MGHLDILDLLCLVKESESEVTQSCPTLCDPMDCSLPDSSLHGILQARVLEWVAISFSRGSSRPRDRTRVSCIPGRCFNLWANREAKFKVLVAQSCLTLSMLWTIVHQAPLSMEFSRQENWSGSPFPSPGDLSNPGIKPGSPAFQADALTSEPPGKHLNAYLGFFFFFKPCHMACGILVPQAEIKS